MKRVRRWKVLAPPLLICPGLGVFSKVLYKIEKHFSLVVFSEF
eukprot:UN02339